MTELDAQIHDLQNQANKLHAKIISMTYNPDKEPLIKQRSQILQKVSKLREEQSEQKEKRAILEIDQLFNSTNRIIILTVEGTRRKPDKDLTFTLPFNCGKHEKRIHVKELLTYQRTSITQDVLLNKWKGILNSNGILDTRFRCGECLKAKNKRKRLLHKYDDSPIGTCHVTLQIV